jgi:hypothetical protein
MKKSLSVGRTVTGKVSVISKEGVNLGLREKIKKIIKEITEQEVNVKPVVYSDLDKEFEFKKPLLVICMPDVYLLSEEIQSRWPNPPVTILALQDVAFLEEHLRQKMKEITIEKMV